MEPTQRRHLTLGEQLQGTVFKPLGGRRYAMTCKAVPQGWRVELHTRQPEKIELGANHSCWVARITPLKSLILVHDGDFGRLPISETMRVRYLAALKALLGEDEFTGEDLSDARSMIVRIEQKNQADWLTVWKTIGEPGPGDVKELLHGIDAIRQARKEDPSRLAALRSAFVTKYGWELESAIQRLEP